jgi:hypothetical protein
MEAYRLAESYKINSVVATSEVDIIRASRISDWIGITKKNEINMELFRDKVKMKQRASELSIQIPHFRTINNSTDLINASKEIGFPMVIKPTLYGGAVGLSIVNEGKDLNPIVASIMLKPDISSPMIAEEFIEGEMVHCDGIYLDGRIPWALTSKYIEGCLAFRESKLNGGFTLPSTDAIHLQCLNLVDRFIRSVAPQTSFVFHAEFFINKEIQSPIFCEIAARPGGSKIREMIRFATGGFDTFHAHALLQAREFNRVSQMLPTKNHFASYLVLPPGKGELRLEEEGLPEFAELESFSYSCLLKNNAKLEHAKHSGDELASCVFSDETFEGIQEKIKITSDWLIRKHKIKNMENQK